MNVQLPFLFTKRCAERVPALYNHLHVCFIQYVLYGNRDVPIFPMLKYSACDVTSCFLAKIYGCRLLSENLTEIYSQHCPWWSNWRISSSFSSSSVWPDPTVLISSELGIIFPCQDFLKPTAAVQNSEDIRLPDSGIPVTVLRAKLGFKIFAGSVSEQTLDIVYWTNIP